MNIMCDSRRRQIVPCKPTLKETLTQQEHHNIQNIAPPSAYGVLLTEEVQNDYIIVTLIIREFSILMICH